MFFAGLMAGLVYFKAAEMTLYILTVNKYGPNPKGKWEFWPMMGIAGLALVWPLTGIYHLVRRKK
jgi:hypothetical protein